MTINACYYCGSPADTTDHVIPRALLLRLQSHPELRRDLTRGRRLTVPACRECNSLLGATFQETLEERKDYLKDRLKRRYAKFLRIPKWDDHAIADLGENLQHYVLVGLVVRDFLQERLRW